MIDTENKRRSIIASGLDSMTIRPNPGTDMDMFDRRHRAAHYRIETQLSRFFFWRQDDRSTTGYIKVHLPDSDFKKASNSTGDWVPVEKIDTIQP